MSAKSEFEAKHGVSFEQTAWGSWEVELEDGARYTWSEKLDRVLNASGETVAVAGGRSVTPDFEAAPTAVQAAVEASDGFKHGTRYGYQIKRCRCDECAGWSREYQKERYHSRKASARKGF